MIPVIPKIRPRDALAAMEECPFDHDDHRQLGNKAVVYHGAPDILIPNNHGPTGDAQRFASTGNEEDQANAGVLQHVVEGIDTPVAAAIRNGERLVIETSYESYTISLRRQIDHAKRIG